MTLSYTLPMVTQSSSVRFILVKRLKFPKSRSVSAPSSVTYTSPCWYGLMFPASTLMYGSHFIIAIFKPLHSRRLPIALEATPFPKLEQTPLVTKIYLLILRLFSPFIDVSSTRPFLAHDWRNRRKRPWRYVSHSKCDALYRQERPVLECDWRNRRKRDVEELVYFED